MGFPIKGITKFKKGALKFREWRSLLPFFPSSLQSGVRFRALPTQEQTHVLGQWIGCQRFIYNGKIDETASSPRSAAWRCGGRGSGMPNATRPAVCAVQDA